MGSKNTLADTLSRLLDVCPEAKLDPEPQGQEFGCYCFEELTPVEVEYIEEVESIQIQESENFREIKLPLRDEQIQLLQRHDSTCREVAKKLQQDKHMNKLFMLKKGIVYRLWCKDDKTSECVVIPEVLRDPLLMLAHDYSGHNGFRRTYNAMKRRYYWPGMRKDILRHCKRCHQCSLQNQGTGEVGFDHFNVPSLPMEFICMDLVGPISPQTTKGNHYMLTIIDMLTGYTIAVAIPDKKAETVCSAYRDHVYCIFGGSSRILTDNGMEFKSKEMQQICKDLDIKQVFSPVYTPQANGRLEGWHRFLKSCIAKHIRGAEVEWDDLIPLAVSAYNFFPCQSSKESPFVLMFRRDPITPVAKLLEPGLKFYGERGVSLRMDTLRKLYTVVAENICKAREKQPRQDTPYPKLEVNDLVLVKDPDSAVFEPRYMPNYRVTAIYGRNRIEVQDEKGNKSVRHAAHVKHCEPVDKVVGQLPAQTVYEQYGRMSKLLIHLKDVPQIPLELFNGQSQVDKIEEEMDIELSLMSDTFDDSKGRNKSPVTREGVAKSREMEKLIPRVTENTSLVVDYCDESRSRHPSTTFNGWTGNKVCRPTGVADDTGGLARCIDESRSRAPSMLVTKDVQCGEVFMLSTVAYEEPTLVDPSDESRNRFQVMTEGEWEHKYGGELLKDVYGHIDSCDESTSRRQNVTLNSNGRKRKDGTPPVSETRTEVFHKHSDTSDDSGIRTQMKAVNFCITGCKNSDMVQTTRLVGNDVSDESTCRNNRCSLSTDQNAQQPVTAVQQDRCIEPTVVNSVSIDKCLVTNKHELSKQDPFQMSNQWLSSTLSRFTSSMLGTSSKIKRGRNLKEISIQVNQTYLLSRSLTSSFKCCLFLYYRSEVLDLDHFNNGIKGVFAAEIKVVKFHKNGMTHHARGEG